MPEAMPVTMPVAEPIVAVAVLLLIHVPPPAAVSVVVSPAHAIAAPDIAGSGSTVSTRVVKQPVDNV
jgi:hypothetical protein